MPSTTTLPSYRATRADAELLAALIDRGAEKLGLQDMHQITGSYASSKKRGMCAMGAAMFAKGKQFDDIVDNASSTWIPAAMKTVYADDLSDLPGDIYAGKPLHDWVVNLNDTCELTFGQISAALRRLAQRLPAGN